MRKNRSPWLRQLNAARTSVTLQSDIATDTTIIGAGIAGVATAFFALKYSQQKVILLEKYKLAHGATGHNAGQVVSYFEVGFANLVQQFGMDLAAEGQRAVEEAWLLINEMYTDAGLDVPFSRFFGHEGFVSLTQLTRHLEDNFLRREAGLRVNRIMVATTAPFIDAIPERYTGLWSAAPHRQLLDLLETHNSKYVAVLSEQKGVVNSALFCELVVEYLLKQYPERFSFFEHAPVHKIILRDGEAVLDADRHTVTAKRVVLCTNGFESLHIINESGLEIDARYHALVHGGVGYMSAYLEPMDKPPTAISYYNEGDETPQANYIYVTRRPYDYEKGQQHNLVCIGGPELYPYEEKHSYLREAPYPDSVVHEIEEFVTRVYQPGARPEYEFTWHGLMGYTKNGVRMVGPEPQNATLLYNLGCNGVGILPSIMGGRKIARHLAGEKVGKSIFDIPTRVPATPPTFTIAAA